MNRFVIYSALVGKYDLILQPEVVDDRFDYVLFSNDISELQVGVWSIRHIDYHHADPTRICRYVKTHPGELLPGYEFHIWMDSNVQILTDYIYSQAIFLYDQKVEVAGMYHPVRKCVYEEAFAVMNMLVEHESIVVDWCQFLRKERYPRNQGLVETNVLFRRDSEAVEIFDRLWWECIEHHSRRDQLSFNYCLWKLNIPLVYFSGKGNNARNTDDFRLLRHQDLRHNQRPLGKNEAWLMRYCWKNKEKEREIEELYYRLYAFPFSRFWVAAAGQWYRLKYLLENRKGNV